MRPSVFTLKAGERPDLPPGRELTTPEAIALAEFSLILHDLKGSLLNFKNLEAAYPQDKSSREARSTAEALFRDGIVQFAACFDEKMRTHLSAQDVFGASQAATDTIEYVRSFRDTYAAHRFGPQRQAFVVVFPTDPPLAPGYAFSTLNFVFSLPEAASIPKYVELLQMAVSAAEKRVDECNAVVTQQLAGMSEAAITALPMLDVRPPAHDQFRNGRNSFRSGGKSRGRRS